MQPGKTKWQYSTYFTLIFHLFSAYVPHPPFFYPHVYRICLFLPIFCLKWYPILVINSSMVPICCFSVYIFTDSVYFPPCSNHFPPIFHLTFCPFSPVLSCRELTPTSWLLMLRTLVIALTCMPFMLASTVRRASWLRVTSPLGSSVIWTAWSVRSVQNLTFQAKSYLYYMYV